MIIGKAAGIDVITIARKALWGQFIPPRFLDSDYCYLVFPELINRNTKAVWSVLQWSYILHRVDLSHFFFFFFRNKGFFRGRGISLWWSPFRHPVEPLQSATLLGSDAVCSRSSGDQTLLLPFLSLAARIWDPPAVTTNFTQKLSVTVGRWR
jgi:hypothetical protein